MARRRLLPWKEVSQCRSHDVYDAVAIASRVESSPRRTGRAATATTATTRRPTRRRTRRRQTPTRSRRRNAAGPRELAAPGLPSHGAQEETHPPARAGGARRRACRSLAGRPRARDLPPLLAVRPTVPPLAAGHPGIRRRCAPVIQTDPRFGSFKLVIDDVLVPHDFELPSCGWRSAYFGLTAARRLSFPFSTITSRRGLASASCFRCGRASSAMFQGLSLDFFERRRLG